MKTTKNIIQFLLPQKIKIYCARKNHKNLALKVMRHDVASMLIIDLAGNFLGQKTHSVYLVCVLRYSRLHPQQLGQKTSKLPVQTTDIFRVEKSLCFRRKNLGSDKTRCKPADVAMQRTWMYICMSMNIPHFLSSDRPASLHLAHG